MYSFTHQTIHHIESTLTKECIHNAKNNIHGAYDTDGRVVVVVDERTEGAFNMGPIEAHCAVVRAPCHLGHQLTHR